MFRHIFLWLVAFCPLSLQLFPGAVPDEADYRHLYPTVHIGARVYDKFSAHTLSYFLGSLETWRYPKDRMHIAFFVDTNATGLMQDLNRWADELAPKLFRSATAYGIHETQDNWREMSLFEARRRSATFSLITDTNCLFKENALRQLVEFLLGDHAGENAIPPAVVSPLLNAPFGSHSNLQGLMGEEFVSRQKLGSQRVYYANGPLLFNLKHKDSSYLSFDENNLMNYRGSGTPIDVLAFSAYSMNIPIVVSNQHFYGYFFDSNVHSTPLKHRRLLNTFIANLISDVGPFPLPHSTIIPPQFPEPSKFGFDAVFLINLVRRPERLRKMTAILDTIGIDFEVIPAVDGNQLTAAQISELKFLPGYEDPFHRRPMKRGEIGCFLSHFHIWRRMVADDLEKVIILEDDIRFTENGLEVLTGTMEDIIKHRFEWEFIYLGRKKNSNIQEHYVPGHRYLSTVEYSYWTLGYMISKQGAQKLLNAKPLEKLMALDEFLPILYGKHPNKEWTKVLDLPEYALLKAFTTYPVVVEPERYTHQPGYISDTEDSAVVKQTGANGSIIAETSPNGVLTSADIELVSSALDQSKTEL